MRVNIEDYVFTKSDIGKKATDLYGNKGHIISFNKNLDKPVTFKSKERGVVTIFRADGTFADSRFRCLFLGWDTCISISSEDFQKPTTFKASEIFNDDLVEIDIIRNKTKKLEKEREKLCPTTVGLAVAKSIIEDKFNDNQVETQKGASIADDFVFTGNGDIDKTIGEIFNTCQRKKPIKQQFIDFLKREGVIERYKRNWMFCDHYNSFKPIIKKEFYVHQAFLWVESPEGKEFWQKINDKWLEYLKNARL